MAFMGTRLELFIYLYSYVMYTLPIGTGNDIQPIRFLKLFDHQKIEILRKNVVLYTTMSLGTECRRKKNASVMQRQYLWLFKYLFSTLFPATEHFKIFFRVNTPRKS